MRARNKRFPLQLLSPTDEVTGGGQLTLCSLSSGFGGEREAEAGERCEDEEERISDERAGETEEATR